MSEPAKRRGSDARHAVLSSIRRARMPDSLAIHPVLMRNNITMATQADLDAAERVLLNHGGSEVPRSELLTRSQAHASIACSTTKGIRLSTTPHALLGVVKMNVATLVSAALAQSFIAVAQHLPMN
jgi:hypothetical protein